MAVLKLSHAAKALLRDTAASLKGHARRVFMARSVKALGPGGKKRAIRELGWNGQTIRKGMHELESGVECLDGRTLGGRKLAEVHFPNLLKDIKEIVDAQSQTDPKFKTQRLYTRLSAKEVRQQLIQHKGYSESAVPSEDTVRVKLNDLGYRPARVAKTKPKKSPQN